MPLLSSNTSPTLLSISLMFKKKSLKWSLGPCELATHSISLYLSLMVLQHASLLWFSTNVTSTDSSQGLCNTVPAMWDIQKTNKQSHLAHSFTTFKSSLRCHLVSMVPLTASFKSEDTFALFHLSFSMASITIWYIPYVCYLFWTYFVSMKSPWMQELCYILST